MTLPVRSPSSAARRRRSRSRVASEMDPLGPVGRVPGQQHPGEGDVLELPQVAELVLDGQALLARPAEGRHRRAPARPRPVRATPGPAAHWGRSRPHTGAPPRRAGRARRPDLPPPAVSAPSRPASGTGSAAGPDARPAPCSSAGAAWRRADRCVRSSSWLSPTCMSATPRSGGAGLLGRTLQSPRVRAHRLAETALCDPDVGQGDGATHHVGEVPGPSPDWPCPRRTSGAPARDRQSSSTRVPEVRRPPPPPDMVVRAGEVERPPGMGHGAGDVAEDLGLSGPVHGDRTRQSAEPPGHDDHPSMLAPAVVVQPPLGVLQPRLDALELAARSSAPRRTRCSAPA